MSQVFTNQAQCKSRSGVRAAQYRRSTVSWIIRDKTLRALCLYLANQSMGLNKTLSLSPWPCCQLVAKFIAKAGCCHENPGKSFFFLPFFISFLFPFFLASIHTVFGSIGSGRFLQYAQRNVDRRLSGKCENVTNRLRGLFYVFACPADRSSFAPSSSQVPIFVRKLCFRHHGPEIF